MMLQGCLNAPSGMVQINLLLNFFLKLQYSSPGPGYSLLLVLKQIIKNKIRQLIKVIVAIL